MTVVMLPIIGFTLTNAFERQLSQGMKNELKAYSYSIFTVAEVENGQLLMPELLLENQFNVSQSGLYALITPLLNSEQQEQNKVLWQSKSLLAMLLPSPLGSPNVGKSQFSKINLADREHLLYSFSASFSDNGQAFPITLHLIKDQQEFLSALNGFRQKLWTWLLVLMAVFVFLQIVWLLWTLKPLSL